MGEAKKRGSFEERKELSVERQIEIDRIRDSNLRNKPRAKHSTKSQMALLSILGASMFSLPQIGLYENKVVNPIPKRSFPTGKK